MLKRALYLLLGMLLCTSLLAHAIHKLDHLSGKQTDEICTFCLAASSLNSPQAAPAPAAFQPAAQHFDESFETVSAQQSYRRTIFARAPPAHPF